MPSSFPSVMEQLVGLTWNEGNCTLFLVFPSPPLAVCMDGTFHKYTFTVEGNCSESLLMCFWTSVMTKCSRVYCITSTTHFYIPLLLQLLCQIVNSQSELWFVCKELLSYKHIRVFTQSLHCSDDYQILKRTKGAGTSHICNHP